MNCPIDWILLGIIPIEVIAFGVVWVMQRHKIDDYMKHRWDPRINFSAITSDGDDEPQNEDDEK